jgi:hypothetical protein
VDGISAGKTVALAKESVNKASDLGAGAWWCKRDFQGRAERRNDWAISSLSLLGSDE